jgi:hypothetical protein
LLFQSARATDIVPNPSSPGNLGQSTNAFPNIYGTNISAAGVFTGNGSGLTNLAAGQITGTVAPAQITNAPGFWNAMPPPSVLPGITDTTNSRTLATTNSANVHIVLDQFAGERFYDQSGVLQATISSNGIALNQASGSFAGNGSGLTNLPFARTLTGTNMLWTPTVNPDGSTNWSGVLTNVPAAKLTGAVPQITLPGSMAGIGSAVLAPTNSTLMAYFALLVNSNGVWTQLQLGGTNLFLPLVATNGYAH